MIVLDANILIRAVMGRRVRQLLEQHAEREIRFCAPDQAFIDAERYLPELLGKRGKPTTDVGAALAYLKQLVEPIDRDTYGVFEEAARERLRLRDEDDWPILATALALGCPLWTEDADFFGTGIAVWTTNHIEIFLRGPTPSS
jgi:predicted nucleic acid-binding protein